MPDGPRPDALGHPDVPWDLTVSDTKGPDAPSCLIDSDCKDVLTCTTGACVGG